MICAGVVPRMTVTEQDDQATGNLRVAGERRLTAAEFRHLAAVPAAVEWFANIENPRTRRAHQGDLEDFCGFVGLTMAEEFRSVNRAHVLAWRAALERRGLAGATIRRKFAALASLFGHRLANKGAAGGNAVNGVKRPEIETNEGKTPALGVHQTEALLEAPHPRRWKGLRDRAIWRCRCTTTCAAKKRRC